MNKHYRGYMMELTLLCAVTLLFAGAQYAHRLDPPIIAARNSVGGVVEAGTIAPAGRVAIAAPTPTPAIITTPLAPARIVELPEVGLALAVPEALDSLQYSILKTAPSERRIAFGTAQLSQLGCRLEQAPLGFLTDQSDNSLPVAVVHGTAWYYAPPLNACPATQAPSSQAALRASLTSLASNNRPGFTP